MKRQLLEKNLRVTTDIWVYIFLRRETNRGAFATVRKKGASEAGAIYIVENPLEGTFNLYGPAPQSLIYEEAGDRKFESVLSVAQENEVETYLAKLKNFDPDIWIIETECRQGPPSISVVHNDTNSMK